MALTYREQAYKTFGRVLAIENGDMELYVTLDIGPRIIHYALAGGENFMFEDVNAEIVNQDASFDSFFYPGAFWRTYGGHRIWLTPEAWPDSYIPDNDPVSYTVEGNVFTFTPPAQKSIHVAERLILTVAENGTEVTVRAEATNIGTQPKTFGMWQLTVMCPNGLAIVPQTVRDTHLLHNRRMSLWAYTEMNDERVHWGKTLFSLRQDPSSDHPFKVGITNERGFAAYLCHGAMFVKRLPFYADVTYPDDGCNFEIYTNPQILELESLGKLAAVTPGDTISSEEVWSLTPDVAAPDASGENAMNEIIAKYIEK